MRAADAGALVAGGAVAPPAPTPAEVRVLRAFLWDGVVRKVGEVFTLPDARDARALAAWNKVEILPDPEPEAAPAPKAKGKSKEIES